jgi:hypothetical protein
VDWGDYPDEVVDRKWRTDAARLHRVLDTLGVRRCPDPPAADPHGPTLARVLDHLSAPPRTADAPGPPARPPAPADGAFAAPPDVTESDAVETDAAVTADGAAGPEGREEVLRRDPEEGPAGGPHAVDLEEGLLTAMDQDEETGLANERSAALAAGLSAELAREEAADQAAGTSPPGGAGQAPGAPPWDQDSLPLFPLQPPRTGRELLTDHVTAMVCCAAMDTAGATPGLDWLDGPTLLVDGVRAADLGAKVLALVEDGDPVPLRTWLIDWGIRPEKPVRLG